MVRAIAARSSGRSSSARTSLVTSSRPRNGEIGDCDGCATTAGIWDPSSVIGSAAVLYERPTVKKAAGGAPKPPPPARLLPPPPPPPPPPPSPPGPPPPPPPRGGGPPPPPPPPPPPTLAPPSL